MDLKDYAKRALDRYDDPTEPHNKDGGFPRGSLAWAMASDLREGLKKTETMFSEPPHLGS